MGTNPKPTRRQLYFISREKEHIKLISAGNRFFDREDHRNAGVISDGYSGSDLQTAAGWGGKGRGKRGELRRHNDPAGKRHHLENQDDRGKMEIPPMSAEGSRNYQAGHIRH
jgi:hypothetical protein